MFFSLSFLFYSHNQTYFYIIIFNLVHSIYVLKNLSVRAQKMGQAHLE